MLGVAQAMGIILEAIGTPARSPKQERKVPRLETRTTTTT